MGAKYLQVGDVIKISMGQEIYIEAPEKFWILNARMSDKIKRERILVGDILECTIDMKETMIEIAESIKEVLDSHLGLDVEDSIVYPFVKSILKDHRSEKLDTRSYAGEYVVVKAYKTGGDGYSYPDGHFVECVQLKHGAYDKDGAKISFYQSGAFTATIEPHKMTPIRRMEMTFV